MKEKRVPCPSCKELIIPGAKKCRFCGEKLTTKAKSISVKALFWIWISSLVVFSYSLLMGVQTLYYGKWFLPMLISVMLGGLVFLILLVEITKGIKKPQTKWYGLATTVVCFAFFALLFNFKTVQAKLGIEPVDNFFTNTNPPPPSTNSLPTTQPTSNPVIRNSNQQKNSNQITCTGPDGKTFQTTQQKCDEFNTAWGNNQQEQSEDKNNSELVSCELSYGTYQLSQEDCKVYKELGNSPLNYQIEDTYILENSTSTNYTNRSSTDNSELRDKCRGDLQYSYQQEMNDLNQKARFMSASSYEFQSSQIKKRYERSEQDCNTRYP